MSTAFFVLGVDVADHVDDEAENDVDLRRGGRVLMRLHIMSCIAS